MEGPQKKFLKDGIPVYPRKVDTIITHPGKNRIKLGFNEPSESVKRAKIYWRNKSDSIIVNVDSLRNQSVNDTVSVIINDLPEGTYTFQMVNFDREGNKSVQTEATSRVYGDNYQNIILPRTINEAVFYSKNNQLRIKWDDLTDSDAIFTIVNYKDLSGMDRKDTVLYAQNKDTLFDFDLERNFDYRTMYLPESLAIDTFRTKKVVGNVTRIHHEQIPKSGFEPFHLPTDYYKEHSAGYSMKNLWDGITNTHRHILLFVPPGSYPTWFTFDMGVKAKLYRMKLFSRKGQSYVQGDPKEFEIWGSNNPDPDGGWDNWVKLGHFVDKKPSGVGPATEEDKNYAEVQGKDFTFPDFKNTPAVRYIRFKLISTWDGNTSGSYRIAELTFWGDIK
jgi:hypothetical protein